ncbi:hypothetical protein AQ477_29465 [Burkholderia thailandensis]|nr:hypothetical protein AQ477_29465 [Burkholderia thailandensis]KXF57536.1 hypothetical protein AQ476_22360 [Burkholderia thailandensis]
MIKPACSFAPAARGATNVLWRGGIAADAGGVGATLFRTRARVHHSPFAMLAHVDGRALSALDALYSRAWHRPVPEGIARTQSMSADHVTRSR